MYCLGHFEPTIKAERFSNIPVLPADNKTKRFTQPGLYVFAHSALQGQFELRRARPNKSGYFLTVVIKKLAQPKRYICGANIDLTLR